MVVACGGQGDTASACLTPRGMSAMNLSKWYQGTLLGKQCSEFCSGLSVTPTGRGR